MATPNDKKPSDNPFTSYYETAEGQAKQFLGWQFKATQEMMDQGLKLAQTWGEFSQTQFQEGARLSQELLKTGFQAAETVKKTFTPIFEKTQSTFTK